MKANPMNANLSIKTTMKRSFAILALSALSFSFTMATETDASAAGATAFTVAQRMPAQSLVTLKRDVAQARAIDSKPFVNVNALVTNAPEADAKARGRKAATAQYLAKLGPSALMPMLEMLAIEAPKGVPADALPSVRRDLIEAVGLLRDAKALPVLTAILDDKSEDADTTRSAAEAVARLNSDEAATRILIALDASSGERTRAILAGMGECRRMKITEALASRLRSNTDEATGRVIARSLSRAGNAWAWQTAADKTDEARIREAAARALVDGFVHQTGEARDAAAKALLVVDDSHTPALIADARKAASPDLQKALDDLAAKLAHNPTR